MEPNRIGRVLGIGARLAAGKIREQAAKVGQAAEPGTGASGSAAANQPAGQTAEKSGPAEQVRPAVRAASGVRPAARVNSARPATAVADGGRRLMQGAGRFGSAMVKPLAHAGNNLMLQVTGIFFGIFAVFFLSHTWQTWRATRWHDRHAAVYLGLGLLFTWFTVSSFWRAKRKQRG
jgi:hypothetical protein